jgi:hypothetical protein
MNDSDHVKGKQEEARAEVEKNESDNRTIVSNVFMLVAGLAFALFLASRGCEEDKMTRCGNACAQTGVRMALWSKESGCVCSGLAVPATDAGK